MATNNGDWASQGSQPPVIKGEISLHAANAEYTFLIPLKNEPGVECSISQRCMRAQAFSPQRSSINVPLNDDPCPTADESNNYDVGAPIAGDHSGFNHGVSCL